MSESELSELETAEFRLERVERDLEDLIGAYRTLLGMHVDAQARAEAAEALVKELEARLIK